MAISPKQNQLSIHLAGVPRVDLGQSLSCGNTATRDGGSTSTSSWLGQKIRNGKANMANLENVRRLLTEADRWERYTGDNSKQRKRPKSGLRVTAADMVKSGGYR